MKSKLGFSLAAVDDVICAERYTSSSEAPSWKYTVIHFKDPLDERKLKAALNWKMAGAPIDGQTYYKMTEAASGVRYAERGFRIGIPNWVSLF